MLPLPAAKKTTTSKLKKCSKGHQNSPNAKQCWVCGEDLTPKPEPEFKQITQTTVTAPFTANPNVLDISIADPDCKRQWNRDRCDDKDPSGLPCVFLSMGCGVRAKRFKMPSTQSQKG